ncbi:MAG: ferritin family protein [Pseudomonadota bacterium]
MEREEVCYKREAALEKTIEMEQKSFDLYKKVYQLAKERHIKDLLKELALEELEHKYTLERAFFEETVALHDAGLNEGPSMNLSLILEEKTLNENATLQDTLIYAIHDEKRAVDFYEKMASQCGVAPMERIFKKLQQDEVNHLARLEKLYENMYMQNM